MAVWIADTAGVTNQSVPEVLCAAAAYHVFRAASGAGPWSSGVNVTGLAAQARRSSMRARVCANPTAGTGSRANCAGA